jgi:anti-sigma B factor antagonist
MKATLRQVNSVTVVDMSGRITLGEGCTQLRELIREQLGKGNKHLLLNLADVTYIDSSGIGELVSGFTTVSNHGGKLKLLNLTKKINDLLQVTQLITVFECFRDENEALDSFARPA